MSALHEHQSRLFIGLQSYLSDVNCSASLLGWGLVLVLSYCSLVVLYNLYLHPLRKFPGPFWARCTNLWGRYQNQYGIKAHKIHAAHQKYGPVVRVAPNTLSFSNPGVIRDIYNSKSFVKEKTFYQAKRIFHEDFLLTFLDHDQSHQRRKLASRGFSQAALLDFEPQIASKVHALLAQWTRLAKQKAVVDIYPWVQWFTFDNIYHLLFDTDPQSVEAGKEHFTTAWMRSWRNIYIYKEIAPVLQRLGPFVPGQIGDYFRDVQKWKQFAVDIVRSCRQSGTKTPFLSKLLNDTDGFLGRSLTDSELAEECMGGLFGGSGTTATTFTFVIWETLRRPDVLTKIQNELKTNIPEGELSPNSIVCSKLPYLQAVLNEAFRLHPATIAMLPRTAVEDVVLDGFTIPRGSTVGTQNFTTHRSAEYFEDPESFRPERWLDPENTRIKDALTPFSIGLRKCIGSNLAEMELRMLAAAFFLRFEGTVDESMQESDMVLYDTFNASPVSKKLLVCLKLRQGSKT